MEVIALLIVLFFALLIYVIFSPKEEGTLQERRNDPELNTNNISIHTERLGKLRQSKFRNVMYYQGPKGGRYYYSASGKKVYV